MAGSTPVEDALFWLKFMGMDLKANKYNFFYWICSFFVVVIFILEIAYLYLNTIGIEEFASVGEIAFSVYLVLNKMIMVCFHRRKISYIITRMSNLWHMDKFGEELNDDFQTTLRRIKISLFGYRLLAVCTTIFFIPLKPLLLKDKALPILMWEPIDMSGRPLYEVAFFIESLISLFGACVNVATDTLFVAIITQIIYQLKLVGEAFRRIHVDYFGQNTEEEILGLVKNYVQQHNYLLEIIKDIQQTFSLLFISMFVCTTMYLGTDLLFIASDKMFSDLKANFKYLTQGMSFLFLLFSYCYAGNKLSEECSAIGDRAYECHWTGSRSSNLKNSVRFVMHRSQKEPLFSAGGLIHLNFTNFIKILRISFSFFTLMRASVNKNK